MLTCTFRHFKGIGAKTERELWRSGVLNWEAFATKKAVQLSMFDVASTNDEGVQVWTAKKALARADADYFARHLPRPEHYRIALGFPSQTLFLDIETTGLSRYYDVITLVGWSIGGKYGVYIKGDDPAFLLEALSDAKALVTFNGSLFDIPFLHQEFPAVHVPAAHVDLRFLSRRVGLVGGQKEIESRVGLQRPGVLSQLQGEAAPLLWHKYRRGDLESLKLLISYNYADIEGMKFVLDTVVERLIDLDKFPREVIRPHKFSGGPSHLTIDELFGPTKFFVREYKGNRGPLVHVSQLNVPHHRIVGIDLTGSESRPSGWSFLHDGRASTQRIGSDRDLIAATIAVRPELVSIDSPLTLPRGRITVSDDDPGRQAFGITRECERILKKRGVNVYPSLIRSMQALTARGIRLAKYFRKIGIPVIESYPGAAQDIMNIPRKRADLSLLKEGLLEFGISGEFKQGDISHDELDAITSAIVGLFFLSGRFEALGNEEEDYLIIPDLKTEASSRGNVIGLSGPICSGKTTAGKYLESCGFSYVSYNEVLQVLLGDAGIQVTQQSIQQMAKKIYEGRGQRWLGSEVTKRISGNGNVIIDGLRYPEDHSFLTERFGRDFIHIHIDAAESIRQQRYHKGLSGDFAKSAQHVMESDVGKMKELAGTIIENVGAPHQFIADLHKAINLP